MPWCCSECVEVDVFVHSTKQSKSDVQIGFWQFNPDDYFIMEKIPRPLSNPESIFMEETVVNISMKGYKEKS